VLTGAVRESKAWYQNHPFPTFSLKRKLQSHAKGGSAYMDLPAVAEELSRAVPRLRQFCFGGSGRENSLQSRAPRPGQGI